MEQPQFYKFGTSKLYLLLPEMLFTDACGGMLETPNGTITSPSFPEIYPANKRCTWEIVAEAHHRITLNFTHFDLEGNNVSFNSF